MPCNCYYTVVQFFNGAWRLLGWNDALGCDNRFSTLNIALEQLYVDTYLMDYQFGVVPFVSTWTLITISTDNDSYLPWMPINSIDGFYTHQSYSNTTMASCLKETEEECFACCSSSNKKTYKIDMYNVLQQHDLLDGQYFVNCNDEGEIYAKIPCNITDWFVKYRRSFNKITSLRDCLPVPRKLIPALVQLLMYYALPSMGIWFKWDDVKYYQNYQNCIAAVYAMEWKTAIRVDWRWF